MSQQGADRYDIVGSRSAVIIEARSSVGPIEFATTSLGGFVECEVSGGRLDAAVAPKACLEVPLTGLVSGNGLYDAELQRRLDTRRFPTARIELEGMAPLGRDDRFEVHGPVTIHGVTQVLAGTVTVVEQRPGVLVVEGEHLVDIRDFDVAAPTMVMLRIFPDVRVALHLEAQRQASDD